MKTSLIACASLAAALTADIQAQTITWTNTSSGGWNTAVNWSPNTVPGSNNTVIINQPGVIVSLNSATTSGAITLGTNSGGTVTLSLAGQTLTIYGPLTVSPTGSFTVDSGMLIGNTNAVLNGKVGWTAGYLEGILTLANESTLTINGTTLNIPGCIFTNNGTVNWTNGTIQSGGATVIYNNGLWDMQSDQTINDAFGGVGAVFNNYGTLRKSGGASEFTNDTLFASGVVFNQLAGVLDVENGTNGLELAFAGGGNFTGGYITTNQFGLTVLSSGNFTIDGAVTGTNTWQDSGNLVGANVISGALTWVGGNWNSATSVTITPNSALTIAGGTGNSMNMQDCLVTNNGTVIWASGIIEGGGNPGGTIIYNSGLWNMQSDQTLNDAYGGAGTVFNNYGTLRKSGGASEFSNDTLFASGVVFNQLAGVLDVQNGTNGLELAFAGGGNFTGGYVTTNQFGLTVLSSGNFNINGAVTGTNTWQDAGNLVGVNVINGALTWVGGNWNAATSVTITPNTTLTIVGGIGNAMNMEDCLVTNNGTVIWASGIIEGGGNPGGTIIYNNSLWDMQSDQMLNDVYGGAGTVFNNYGTLRKSGGANTNQTEFQSITLNQISGVVDVETGNLVLTGTENLTGGSINNTGTVYLSSGTFTLNGTATSSNVVDNPGVMVGTNVINGALTWQYGSWNNTVVTVSTNSVLYINTVSGNHNFGGVTFTNNGTVNWSQDRLYGGGGTAVYNYGLWNAQDDQILDNNYGGAGTVFNNYGTLRKSGGTTAGQTEFLTVTLNQISGVVDVETGNLTLAGIENLTGGSINDTGTVYLSTGTFTLNGTATSSNVVDNPGVMTGVNVINGALTWQNGSWNNTVVTVSTNSVLYINTTSGAHNFGGVTLTNKGTVDWSQARLYGGGGTAVYNYGLWNAQDDQILDNNYGGAGTVFNNYGTLRKSGGTTAGQTEFLTVTLNQISGVVDVETGNLTLAGIENLTGGSINDTGTVYLSTGTFTLNGTATSSNVVDNPGVMTGVNVINGALTWQNGSWNNTVVTVSTNSVLYINTTSGAHNFGGVTLTNKGTVDWSQARLYGGGGTAVYNYGLWNAQDDQILDNNYGGGGTLFANYGRFRKIGTGGGSSQFLSGVTFTNTGTLDAQVGNISMQGAYSLAGGRLNTGINSLTNYGTISLSGAAALTGAISANLNNFYQPSVGNAFTNIFYGSFTGAFSSFAPPSSDTWNTNYTATAFYLQVAKTVAMPVELLTPQISAGNFTFGFGTVNNQSYTVQDNTNLATTNWVLYTNFIGNGSNYQFIEPVSNVPAIFFRVREP